MRYPDEGAVNAIQFANESIGRKIRAKREALDLTQSDLAKKVGMRPEIISRIESGQGNPTIATIRRVLKTLGEW